MSALTAPAHTAPQALPRPQRWERPARFPALPAGEVHVWLCDLDCPPAPGRGSALAADELARAERIAAARVRARWIAARAELRALLGAYLALEPRELRVGTGPRGKPRLEPPAGAAGDRAKPPLEFSVSHSGGLALLAFARSGAVGVDVERVRGREIPASLARRALGPRRADRVAALPAAERECAFLQEWTRREACAKHSGAGVWALARLRSHRQPRGLWVGDLDPGREAVAAIALERAPEHVRCLRAGP